MNAAKITRTVGNNRRRILEETVDLYRLEDFSPNNDTRSTNVLTGHCKYRGPENRRCAIARLGPDKPWHEGMSCAMEPNRAVALVVAREQGIHSGDDGETLSFMRNLQLVHDCEDREEAFKAFRRALGATFVNAFEGEEVAK